MFHPAGLQELVSAPCFEHRLSSESEEGKPLRQECTKQLSGLHVALIVQPESEQLTLKECHACRSSTATPSNNSMAASALSPLCSSWFMCCHIQARLEHTEPRVKNLLLLNFPT